MESIHLWFSTNKILLNKKGSFKSQEEQDLFLCLGCFLSFFLSSSLLSFFPVFSIFFFDVLFFHLAIFHFLVEVTSLSGKGNGISFVRIIAYN